MTHFILNSRNLVIVLISSNKQFLYAITSNLVIRHTALNELYLNSLFAKDLIEIFPLNHYMRFEFNY